MNLRVKYIFFQLLIQNEAKTIYGLAAAASSAASLLLLLLALLPKEPTFGLAFSLKSVFMVRIFLSPPPGLWLALSNEPIFDLAFHWSFVLMICHPKQRETVTFSPLKTATMINLLSSRLPLVHIGRSSLRCAAEPWNPISSSRFWCSRRRACGWRCREIQSLTLPDADSAAALCPLESYSLKLQRQNETNNQTHRQTIRQSSLFFGGSGGFSSDFNNRDLEELRFDDTSSVLLCDEARLCVPLALGASSIVCEITSERTMRHQNVVTRGNWSIVIR